LPVSTKALSEEIRFNYSITREKAPIYTMGSANCRSYSRNKRGIAGGLIWINFDRHSLLNLFKKAQGKFLADVDEIRPQYQDSSVGASAVFTSSLVRAVGPSIGATIDQIDNLSISEVGGSKELASPWYSDQVLPFDVTIAGAKRIRCHGGCQDLRRGNPQRRLGLLDRRRCQRDAVDLCCPRRWAKTG
jgi:hypothetical protein